MAALKRPDVDVDVKDRKHALTGLDHVPASILVDRDLRRHNTGVFFQGIPVDPVTGLASFPSGKKSEDIAGALGYFKIDILPNHAYKNVRDPDHLRDLAEREPDWDLFLDRDVVSGLQQIGNHFDVVEAYAPRSIEDLACLIALIRPGKSHLIGQEWDVIRREIWRPPGDGSYFYKKSHAIAFATCIVVQLNASQELRDSPCESDGI